MNKLLIRIALLCCLGLTMAVSSLSAFEPDALYQDQVAVLVYHHVSDTVKGPGTISTGLFHDQLSFLQSRKYNFISLDQFKAYLQGGPVPDNAVLVTFDDGYESFYTNAYPVMKELNVPAVSFVITGTIDKPLEGTTPFLNREELASLGKEQGFIGLQSHTDSQHDKQNGKAYLTHHLTVNGRTETDAEYKARLTGDAVTCRKKLGAYAQGSGDTLAYPFGIYNPEAISALQEGGVRYAFTVMPKIVTRSSDPMRLPRLNAGSPYVQPETLHNMIMRRITAVKDPGEEEAPLRETVEQLGGELYKDKADNQLGMNYNGDLYKFSADKTAVTRLADQSVYTLEKPMYVEGRRSYILLKDLEKILGITIRLDTDTDTYTTDPPAKSDSGTES